MKKYVVNLEHRTDRKDKLLEEFKKHNITNYEFIQAVHGGTLDPEEMKARNELIYSLKRGQIGCYLSHVNIYKQILESNEELNLVLEDDIYFVDDFNNKLDSLMERVRDLNWDLFYLGLHNNRRTHHRAAKGEFFNPNNLMGTFAYVIKKSRIESFFRRLFPIEVPIDFFLMRANYIKKLALYDNRSLVRSYNKDQDSDTQLII